MIDFVAIDFETATRNRASICQVGLTEVINGIAQEPHVWLVQPPHNEYEPENIYVHGIRPEDTYEAPTFQSVWNEVRPFLQNRIVVAHNASFDMYALRDALKMYRLQVPYFKFYCSLRIAKYLFKGLFSYSLNVVMKYLELGDIRHHDAGDDSYGCAKVMLKCLEAAECDFDTLEEKLHLHHGYMTPTSFDGMHADRVDADERKQMVVAEYVTQPDENNYFYGKQVCFTGACQFAKRRDMLSMVASIGGIPTDSVTKATDVLVVGQVDYRYMDDEGMSKKQRKALDLLAKGQDIEILSETEFLERF